MQAASMRMAHTLCHNRKHVSCLSYSQTRHSNAPAPSLSVLERPITRNRLKTDVENTPEVDPAVNPTLLKLMVRRDLAFHFAAVFR